MERLLRALPSRPQPPLVRLGVTTLIVGACFLGLLALHRDSEIHWFFVLYPAIFVSALLFNRGSGFFATALSAVLLYLHLKPDDGLWLTADYTAALALFVAIALALAAISEGLRIGWERAVAAEKVKGLLLHELGHRIRNNLAMATSLLLLQARTEASAEARAALERASSRIRAVADAHDHLAPVQHEDRVDMRDYLVKLCGHLREHLGGVRPIALEVDADAAALRTDTAIAIGLIANELVTNALKHAFPDGRDGTVRVAFAAGPPPALTVADDGIGCPPGKPDGHGSRLLQLLVRQVQGTIDWEPARPGCRVRVTAVAAPGRGAY